MLLYLVSSVLVSIILTMCSMFTYHLSLKSLISKDTTFEASGALIASEINCYFEIFIIYLVSTLISAYFFSLLTTSIILLVEFLFTWFVLYSDLWYSCNIRWIEKQ